MSFFFTLFIDLLRLSIIMWFFIAAAGVVFIAWSLMRSSSHQKLLDAKGRLVVVTGCDSGIGLTVALALHDAGCSVLATCLYPEGEGAARLAERGIQVTRLDLRDVTTISALTQSVATMEEQGHKLWCLVNNAGLLTCARFEWQTTDIIQGQLQVNLMGAVLVTKALMSRLKKNKGRVVFVSSPQSLVASPNMAVYCASKAGLDTFANALRREDNAISVSVVRPYALSTQTGILKNSSQQLRMMHNQMDEDALSQYGSEISAMEQVFQNVFGQVNSTQEIQDKKLLKSFMLAILSKQPQKSYEIAPLLTVFLMKTLQILPNCILDQLIARDIHLTIIETANNKK